MEQLGAVALDTDPILRRQCFVLHELGYVFFNPFLAYLIVEFSGWGHNLSAIFALNSLLLYFSTCASIIWFLGQNLFLYIAYIVHYYTHKLCLNSSIYKFFCLYCEL